MSLVDKTWLVIPLYNEGTVIRNVIEEAKRTFPNIICVDDGSRDNSAQEAHAAGAYVATHPVNLGQGAALQTGIDFFLTQTDGRYLVTFDADGQHDVNDALAMVQAAEKEDLGFVFGSRFLGGKLEAGLIKRIMLRFVAFITRLRTGAVLTDAHNGLRAIRRDAAMQVNLKQNRMAHATEIVYALLDTGLKWKEMPTHIRYTDYSRGKGQSILNSINILVELIMK
ncbi:glycosyltransferase family 2 protein [Gleimia hominis]|uniref:Glycosyltransferase family 2 protein n=1 Tax=Gleimia hominis TaxID=595468 RepID=A0ABU3IA08_9ACTO|nr:glycosyltransferase family 2 protein [Gleimia hominis]MDT3767205.1 glycosyltransferase family 2 protein [Gleimia hominis]